jgi:hypothetical protein
VAQAFPEGQPLTEILVPLQLSAHTLQPVVDSVDKQVLVVRVVPEVAAVVPMPQVPVILPHLLHLKEITAELVRAVTMNTTGPAAAVVEQEALVEIQQVRLQSVALEITQLPELLRAVQAVLELLTP